MSRLIEIRVDGVTCTAELHADAPTLTERLWQALPLSGELRHVRWSGEAGYVIADGLRIESPPDERRVSMYARGQILLRPDHAELGFAYGQGQARDSTSRGDQASHVATVVSNLDAFLDRVALTRHTGRCPIEIARADGSR
jgi:hypothetical protein